MTTLRGNLRGDGVKTRVKHLHRYAGLSNISDGTGARIPKMTCFQPLLKDQGHKLEIGD